MLSTLPLLALLAVADSAPASPSLPPAGVRKLEVAMPAAGRGADAASPLVEQLQMDRVRANMARLAAEGRLLPTGIDPIVRFRWPLQDLGSGQFSYWVVTNFVDQDPTWPGQVLDYSCGERTYDTDDGYNHTGIDIVLWPFKWRLMDRGRIAVVAAAAGQIVDRIDGEFDRSCALDGGVHNTIVLLHGDGSQSYYRHLKKNSVTAKQEGDMVEAGEYLGLVGSSGNSTAPHVHFAARDGAEDLVEPYAGFCNGLNGLTSWWLPDTQKPYRDFALLDLSTHDAAPVYPDCPAPEEPNYRRIFQAGETVTLGAFFRDPTTDRTTILSVSRPDGTTYATWFHDHPEERNSEAAFWQVDLPDILLPSTRGRWVWRSSYPVGGGFSVVRERAFWVGVIHAEDFERGDFGTFLRTFALP